DADADVSRGDGLAVGAERHAQDDALLDVERSLRQAPPRGRVEQHHAPAAADADAAVSRGDGLAVGGSRHALDAASLDLEHRSQSWPGLNRFEKGISRFEVVV